MDKERLQQMYAAIEGVDDAQKHIIAPLLTEIVFIEGRLEELRGLPHIRIHHADKTRQEITAAGKQYKEFMQSYLNAIKVIMSALYRSGGDSAAGKLAELLAEFDE